MEFSEGLRINIFSPVCCSDPLIIVEKYQKKEIVMKKRMFFILLSLYACSSVKTAFSTEMEYTNSIGMKMCPVPQGKFTMGSDLPVLNHWDERPQREVTISNPFYMSETEVTVEQYRQFDPGYSLEGRFGDFASGQ